MCVCVCVISSRQYWISQHCIIFIINLSGPTLPQAHIDLLNVNILISRVEIFKRQSTLKNHRRGNDNQFLALAKCHKICFWKNIKCLVQKTFLVALKKLFFFALDLHRGENIWKCVCEKILLYSSEKQQR